MYLPLSTFSILCGTQLGFNAFFFILHQLTQTHSFNLQLHSSPHLVVRPARLAARFIGLHRRSHQTRVGIRLHDERRSRILIAAFRRTVGVREGVAKTGHQGDLGGYITMRYILNQDPRVTFCGYSIPHPSDARVNIRVQTTGDAASEVLKDSCQDLMLVCQHVTSTFDQAVMEFKNRVHEYYTIVVFSGLLSQLLTC
ncbi:hypothetical protein ACS0TY_024571 [Phlomoides rotata]